MKTKVPTFEIKELIYLKFLSVFQCTISCDLSMPFLYNGILTIVHLREVSE